jgi:hypothetical protein
MIEIKYPQNSKEYVVSCEFAAKPRRPEDLSKELKDRGVTSRASFYRVLKRIKKDSVIYPISEQEKKQFGLVDKDGNTLKGKYYFAKDEFKTQRWDKIMEKIRTYDGNKSPSNLLRILTKEFGGYPLISVSDVVEIARFHKKLPKDNLYNDEEEILRFLEPQINRIVPTLIQDEQNIAYAELSAIFNSCTRDLLGEDPKYVSDEHSKSCFDILCLLSKDKQANEIIRSLFDMDCDPLKEQSSARVRLISDLVKIFSKHYDRSTIVELLNSKIKELSNKEIESLIDDQTEYGNIVRLKEGLVNVLRELGSN